ncbi:MAG: hypothetical protein ACRDOH_08845 [Streptosporangiaceae bacterium]
MSDLPLLDAARRRLGDPEASRRKRRHDAAAAAGREQMARVVDDLIEVADDEYGVGLVTMLREQDFQDALVDEAATFFPAVAATSAKPCCRSQIRSSTDSVPTGSRRWIRDHGKPPVGPVERARLDDEPADARAVAADELGRRVDHDVGGEQLFSALPARLRQVLGHGAFKPAGLTPRR